jgi:hypothetical protein
MAKPQMVILEGDGSFEIEVVGESRYFDKLRAIAGSCEKHEVEVVKTAYLVPEPRNQNDPNAIRVDIDEKAVGYLPRTVAASLAPVLRSAKLVGVQAQARISAFKGADNYSVWLDGNLGEIVSEFGAKRPWWKPGG